MEVRQIAANRILSPTGIPLGEYVINPYKGCFFDCAYCYERKSRRQKGETRQWGEYVDARINAVLKLEQEILALRPSSVLIGSTCDCFQPAEKHFGLTGKIIRVLNKHSIRYSIITRSPLIARYADELDPELCRIILFTVNSLAPDTARELEPHSAPLSARWNAIENMRRRGLVVKPAFAPYLPWLSRHDDVFRLVGRGRSIRIEGLNFNVGNMSSVIDKITRLNPELGRRYMRMKTDEAFYRQVWSGFKTGLFKRAASYGIKAHIDIHRLRPGFGQPAGHDGHGRKTKTAVAQEQNYELF